MTIWRASDFEAFNHGVAAARYAYLHDQAAVPCTQCAKRKHKACKGSSWAEGSRRACSCQRDSHRPEGTT